jgi:hypothetical protein
MRTDKQWGATTLGLQVAVLGFQDDVLVPLDDGSVYQTKVVQIKELNPVVMTINTSVSSDVRASRCRLRRPILSFRKAAAEFGDHIRIICIYWHHAGAKSEVSITLRLCDWTAIAIAHHDSGFPSQHCYRLSQP